MKYWDEKFETMPLKEMQEFQLKNLQETLKWVYERVPYYRNKFDNAGVKPEDCKSLEDLARFPFTNKADLRDNYPFGLCAVPMHEVVRIHASSGTTGKPITGPYTREDVDQWAECMARNLFAAGVRSSDVCQNAYGMGLFTGGLGFHQGAEKIGCTIVPASSGMTERQVLLMQDFGATVLFSTPSYALTIAEKAREMGIDMKGLPLRIGVFGAEPWTAEMRKEIEERMDIRAMEAYGLTEMGGPGTSFDCSEQSGLHINEDHFIPEIIDPVTEEVLPPGTQGELVFTAIRRRAMPLIRYRTRDITTLRREECACGRTLIKMDKVHGRSDDMLIISGVNVFPSQIESLLLDIPEVEPQYVIIIRKKGYLDTMSIDVEGKPEIYEAGKEGIAEMEKRISRKIKGIIGISAAVRIVPPKTITRSEGKAKRVLDQRGM
ncbi:MAG: phenylacetate--CoA ligase [Deltaproteobacteria bacterium]|nr:phenylacetate--CoA ligase [Deltaproteobacteria bacterium]MBW2121457.1 phenylacetate--CoA ligase [Deltaproteobacteria bacterium]